MLPDRVGGDEYDAPARGVDESVGGVGGSGGVSHQRCARVDVVVGDKFPPGDRAEGSHLG